MNNDLFPIWNKVEACIYTTAKSWGSVGTAAVEVFIGTPSANEKRPIRRRLFRAIARLLRVHRGLLWHDGGDDSHLFLSHRTTRREHDDGRVEFRFYVDDLLVKQAIMKGGELLDNHSRFDSVDTKPTVPACPRCGYGGYYNDTAKGIAQLNISTKLEEGRA